MSVKQRFLKRLEEIKNSKYTPKYKAGDVIINQKFKIVRKVKSVLYTEPDVPRDAEYVFVDLENPFRMSLAISKYNVYKDCRKIDSTYELIDPRSAEIIYGVKRE